MDIHGAGPSSSPIPESDDGDDAQLANSEYLTREEVMKRRARRLQRLAKCYRDHYWALMEDVRRKHRDFIWKFGTEPYKNDYGGENVNINGDDVNNGRKLGFNRCSYNVCGSKAIPLTNYCHTHILSDTKQVLYGPCQYALKSGDDPILCGKTALKSAVPSMCPQHTKISELNIRKALRKGGVSGAASIKLASKFHLVLAEYVKLIQAQRRANVSKRLANGATPTD